MDQVSSQIQSVGFVNALKTGNMVIDMMIAVLIPFIFKVVMDAMSGQTKLLSKDFNWMPWRRYFEREIEHKMTQNQWGETNSSNEDQRNNVLIKSIQLYIDHLKIEFISSAVALVSMSEAQRRSWWQDDDGEGENTPAGKLKKYHLTRKAPTYKWCPLGPKYDDVELKVEESENDKGEKADKTQIVQIYRFRSRTNGAIDSFIDDAYQWYLGELRKLEDNSRYLYEMQTGAGGKSSGGEGGDESRRTYKRYKLSGEKTFESLFFDEKERLLALLKHFTAKTGKYAVSGYPHKLGLLLHGPPGTGKTSLIKALAAHTGRSIVNVPLARINTNQELMDIFFDQQYCVQGDEVPIKLGFKDIIFVMEDVDAASKVVHRRDGGVSVVARVESMQNPSGGFGSADSSGSSGGPENSDYFMSLEGADDTPWRRLLASPNKDVKSLVAKLTAASPRLAAAASSTDAVTAAAAKLHAPPPQLPAPDKSAASGEKGNSDDADGNGSSGSAGEARAVAAAAAKAAREAACAAMSESVSNKEATDRFVQTHAEALTALLDAGAAVDTALEDELLRPDGATWAAQALAQATKAATKALGGTMAGRLRKRQSSVHIPTAGNSNADAPAPLSTAAADDDDGDGGGAADMQTMMATMMSMLPGGDGDASSGGGVSLGPLAPQQSAFAAKRDKLNLSGLLNVLDGVVDTPGRLVVLSTNHPEHLDPALIRPGRIDKKLLLGYMSAPHVVAMMEHYFQGALQVDQAQRVRNAIQGDDNMGLPSLNLTPAQVEQMAAEHDEVEDMVLALELLGLPRPKLQRNRSSTTVTYE